MSKSTFLDLSSNYKIILYKKVLAAQLSPTLWPHEPTRQLCPRDFPGKNTGVGSHSFHQGTSPTQGSNPELPALQAESIPAELPGKNIEGKALN